MSERADSPPNDEEDHDEEDHAPDHAEAAADDGEDNGEEEAGDNGEEEAGAPDEDDDDEDDDDDDDEDQEGDVQLDVRTIAVRVKDLNSHLVCRLCGGYFRDAHTITECLHTFCKACLLKSFAAGSTTCPHCNVSLGPHPANGILFDRTLQALVDKVFTDLEEMDGANEEAFYARLGIKRKPDPDDAPSGHAEPAASSKTKRSRGSIDVEINFKLAPDLSAALPSSLRLTALDKPYLKTCGRLKISQLKKYLSKKLQVERPDDIEVLCHGDALGSELSLQVMDQKNLQPAAPTKTRRVPTS